MADPANTTTSTYETQATNITLTNATLILPSSPLPVPHCTLTLSPHTGLITDIHVPAPSSSASRSLSHPSSNNSTTTTTRVIDTPPGLLIAPGFLDLQVNGLGGVHFTRLNGTTTTTNTTTITTTTTTKDDIDADANADTDAEDVENLAACARRQVTAGVTGWWATVPTVPRERWRGLLGALRPRSFLLSSNKDTNTSDETTAGEPGEGVIKGGGGGAELLGAHCEGPFLEPAKRGAHCAAFMLSPPPPPSGPSHTGNTTTEGGEEQADNKTPEAVYGASNLRSAVRMVTLAPELPGAVGLIAALRQRYPHVRVAMGHSAAGYQEGVEGVRAGACMLTHTFNAMAGVTGREPGLPGLMAGVREDVQDDGGGGDNGKGRAWYSVIGDGVHLHRATLEMALKLGLDGDGNGGGRCIGITDAIELAGLEDGTYQGNGQITGRQVKVGNRVTIEGSQTLVGSCVLVDHVVRELAGINKAGPMGGVSEEWRGIGQEEKGRRLVRSVKAVSQNVADMMGEETRGRLEVGRRADLVLLDWNGAVRQTWVGGRKVFELTEQ